MDTGQQPERAVPQWSGAGARPVVLALVEDRVGSLAALLLAAEIAAAWQARLHVAHIADRRLVWTGLAGVSVPVDLWAEADRLAANQLRVKVADLLALTPAEWTFTWTAGSIHRTAMSLVSELAPVAVVTDISRRHWFRPRRSVGRWLSSRLNVPTVVTPT